MTEDDGWTPEERQALDRLREPAALPAALEERLVSRWRLQSTRRRWRVPAAVAAAFVVGALAGLLISRHRGSDAPARARYVLLLHGSTVGHGTTEAARVEEYRQWARELRSRGQLVMGERLSPATLALPGVNGGESGISGFFVLDAPDQQAAETIARACPHVKHGGAIELRPIDPT